MERKKAVITGGAGFIGSNLADGLLAQGYEVIVIDTLVGGKRENVPAGAALHEIDVLDTAAITQLMRGAGAVFHLAALPRVSFSVEQPVESNRANLDGTVSVLTAAKDAGAGKVVYSASAAAYGSSDEPLREDMPAEPANPYGLQKYLGELYAALFSRVYGLKTVSLRYFNIYGPRMDPSGPYGLAIAKFLEQKKAGAPLTIVGDGTQTRDFTHVRDVVRANIMAAEHSALGAGEVVNIGTGRAVSVNDLAELIDPAGKRAPLPPRVEMHDSRADVRKAKDLMGWEPSVSLEDGIAELKRQWDIP